LDTTLAAISKNHNLIDSVVVFLIFGILVVVMVCFGLLAMAAEVFATSVLGVDSVTLNPGVWYFGYSLAMLAIIVVLALWALRTAMAGQRLWNANLLD
jgi:hypothetical protein